ncbi:hypothetical protein [Erythrobacter sp. Alg231-14]|uniref:hypothetical protein n=1 Tax=Erythrobacter sp. Alg231-14 TaxID=1922225 RepID=UPI000D559958
MIKTANTTVLILLLSGAAACKPPPTDADIVRDMPGDVATFASDPLPSPDTEGAFWAVPEVDEPRIIYGVSSQPPLIALRCVSPEDMVPVVQITRLSPADDGAEALLAMVGNGHIGRIPVDSTDVRGRGVWHGGAPAADLAWEALAGPRQLTLTVPGAGMVTINPSTMPGALIVACRSGEVFVPSPPELEPEIERPEDAPSPVP